jgi:hypothetical protein
MPKRSEMSLGILSQDEHLDLLLEIEQKDAEIERLRGALQRIKGYHPGGIVLSDPAGFMYETAVNALSDER